ncbi:MAG: serine/threonine protein kinase [Isosphaera sp.]|nr:serine/threonine protein kinase [Isosphaera sp.]
MGGMKKVYFSPDRSYVVAFFHDPQAAADANRHARLDAVLGRFNPTTDPEAGEYWKKLFCWPTGVLNRPTLGVVAPAYPPGYFFETGPFKGKEKKGKWFSSPKLRSYLPEAERGDWRNYFQICILISRAVRRLHQAGLAHSDLSCNNVLIDPSRGLSVVIDIDSLVVPGMFPPDVLGTPGYIAPEVLGTTHLPVRDPKRVHPSARTDQHALAVLIYEYLLFRHPLRGPKIYSAASAEEDEHLGLGAKATFVEHPTDRSNRPPDLRPTVADLGPQLADLFGRSFVAGLHAPDKRPGAIEWERGLVKTWDLLHPCLGPKCPSKWFVLHGTTAGPCPFCGAKPPGPVPVLRLRKEVRPGQWLPDANLVVHDAGLGLFDWHVLANVFPGERADRTRRGYFARHQGKWLLVNEGLASLTSPAGSPVPPGAAVELKPGAAFRLSKEPNGRLAVPDFLPG